MGRLESDVDDSGRRVVTGASLAALAVELARDSSRDADLVLDPQSARNRLTGLVTRITKDGALTERGARSRCFVQPSAAI